LHPAGRLVGLVLLLHNLGPIYSAVLIRALCGHIRKGLVPRPAVARFFRRGAMTMSWMAVIRTKPAVITMTKVGHQPRTACKWTKRIPAKKASGKEPKASYARSSRLLRVGSKSRSRMGNPLPVMSGV
jgi:hypothetical protein